MNKKILAPLIALVALGGGYKFVLAKPEPKKPEPKVAGDPYVVPKEFLLNLEDERYAKLTVGLVLPHEVADKPAEGEESAPPEGWGESPQEGVVRAVVTETLTGASASELLRPGSRKKIEEELLKELRSETDLKPVDVLITDLTVQ
jgi:flagellar FliL protein